jgi:uncharacterized protein YndB with AHSA1/START domain
VSDVVERIVEVRRHLEASPEDVFAFLTEAERYTTWMGRSAELDPRPGGIYRVQFDDRTIALGEYVEVEPFRRLVFTWGWVGDPLVPPGTTTVEITLEPEGDGTSLTVRHSDLPDDAVATHVDGWELYLGRLASLMAGAEVPPEPLHP